MNSLTGQASSMRIIFPAGTKCSSKMFWIIARRKIIGIVAHKCRSRFVKVSFTEKMKLTLFLVNGVQRGQKNLLIGGN